MAFMKMIVQFMQDISPENADIESLLKDIAKVTGTEHLSLEDTHINLKSLLQE